MATITVNLTRFFVDLNTRPVPTKCRHQPPETKVWTLVAAWTLDGAGMRRGENLRQDLNGCGIILPTVSEYFFVNGSDQNLQTNVFT